MVINANTIFNGDATIVSQGEDETTIIQGGSITFTRGGKPITVIRNIKIGTVETDGDGREIDLSDLKSCDVITSIHSFDITSNIRSLSSGATQTDPVNNKWKIYLYGSEAVLTGGSEGTFNFGGNIGEFMLEYVKLTGSSLQYTLKSDDYIWDADTPGSAAANATSYSISSVLNIECEIVETNSLGSSVIGFYSGTIGNGVYAQGYASGSRIRVRIPSQTATIPISIDRTLAKLQNSTLTISLKKATVNVTGTATYATTTKYINVSNAQLYVSGNNSFKYVYYKEQNSPIQGKGVVQYMAIEK